MKSIQLVSTALLFATACGTGSLPEQSSEDTASPATGTQEQELWWHRHQRTLERVVRTDIVSDQPGALRLDPTLVNAWGLAFSYLGSAWVSAADSSVSAVYNAEGQSVLPNVIIPGPDPSAPGNPTGQVFNGNPTVFMGDSFIFVTEQGTIAAWQVIDKNLAVQRVDSTKGEANYKGVTIGSFADSARLYAADFHNGKIDVFDATYAPVETKGGFKDDTIPAGFAPFNVQEANGNLVVTYAKQDDDREDEVKGAGFGYVNLFDTDGNLISRLVSQRGLNAPWGVAMTPATFGRIPNRLLIGNFGDGRINVYRLEKSGCEVNAVPEGQLGNGRGAALEVDGLWALRFGLGVGGFKTDTLYFTAGPDEEAHGVFGRLEIKSK